MSKPDSYLVGYGKPPANGRFQLGKSGNPKGRPKRLPNIHDIVAALMKRKITITEDGNSKKIIYLQALARKLMHQALKGDKYSTELILGLHTQHLSKTKATEKPAHIVNIEQYTPKELELLEELMLSFERREHK